MELLHRMRRHVGEHPEALAIRLYEGESVSYQECWQASEAVAAFLSELGLAAREPVVVYGHKSPLMLACFHACLKSGHPCVPVDRFAMPSARVEDILSQLGGPLVLVTEELPAEVSITAARVVGHEKLQRVIAAFPEHPQASDESAWIDGDEVCYVLFVPGPDGRPRGVQLTAAGIDGFCRWAFSLGELDGTRPVFLNQAPFSSEFSAYEQAMPFWSGGSLYCVTKETQDDHMMHFRSFMVSGADVWVSTPSFVEDCLLEHAFGGHMLQNLKQCFFYGEMLSGATARRLLRRFPQADIVSVFGRAEFASAAAIVVNAVTPPTSEGPLAAFPNDLGARIRIVGKDDGELPLGELGEVVVEGDCVAKGYFGPDRLGFRAFGESEVDGEATRSYHTGDRGFLGVDGKLHFRGRFDRRLNLRGLRVEPGEIESCLLRLDEVREAAVVPSYEQGRVVALYAHVVSSASRTGSDFRESVKLRAALKPRLPQHMIPRKFVFHESLPKKPDGRPDYEALMQP